MEERQGGAVAGWKRLAIKACAPSYFCTVVAVAWLGMWIYVLIGAAIIMAIENPTRRLAEATALHQGELSYLDAVYWTETYLSSCGFGDIVPVTDGGRGFLYVWAFFGCGLWALITGAMVSLAYDWVLFGLVLWPVWHVRHHRRKRRLSLHASAGGAIGLEMSAASTLAVAMGQTGMGGSLVEGATIDLVEAEAADNNSKMFVSGLSNVAVNTINASQVNEAYGDLNPSALEAQIKAQEVLTWPAVSLLVLSGVVVYFGVHLVGAAVFLAIEPDLAFYKLPRYFPNSFGDGLYFTITASQTMCMGEYSPQTNVGKAFYLAWHQQGLISSSFLFSTVTVAILKWSKSRAFHVLERIARAYRRIRRRGRGRDRS